MPILLVALPYYLLRMWRRGGYAKDLKHRLGLFTCLPKPASGKERIWLQAVSVGEVLAIGPLIQALQEDPKIEIVLTTTTSTGYREARKRYTDQVLAVGIFPLDFWLFSGTAWKRIQPDCLILTESELWPEHLHRAKGKGVPAFLVNARISDRSFARYQKFPIIAQRLLAKFNQIFAASDLDGKRLQKLGVANAKITATGNIKFDVPLSETISPAEKATLLKELGFEAEGPETPFILLGSSTWPGEEAALLEAYSNLVAKGVPARLLLVPRHAERGPEIARLLSTQTLPWHQRSKNLTPSAPVRIYLADTTGELSRLSQIADLAFIGKSLAPNEGGQTPIEAAGLGIPILMGPNMNNFRVVSISLIKNGAARSVKDNEALITAIKELNQDTASREKMSHAGRQWHTSNRGSSQRIASSILKSLF